SVPVADARRRDRESAVPLLGLYTRLIAFTRGTLCVCVLPGAQSSRGSLQRREVGPFIVFPTSTTLSQSFLHHLLCLSWTPAEFGPLPWSLSCFFYFLQFIPVLLLSPVSF